MRLLQNTTLHIVWIPCKYCHTVSVSSFVTYINGKVAKKVITMQAQA